MKVHVPFKLDPEMLAELDKRARELGHTRSEYIRRLIENHLKPASKAGITPSDGN